MSRRRGRFLVGPALAALGALAAGAHPSVSVVRDAAGNVYYSDLAAVWQLAPDGTRRVVVDHVHTHELYLDAHGDLFGEHLWYEGARSDRWGHRVWVRHSDGRVEDVYPARAGFRTDYSFARDAAGAHYWIEQGRPSRVRRRIPGGGESVVATLPDSIPGPAIGWLAVAAGGEAYFTAAGRDLYAVSRAGAVRPLATDLVRGRLSALASKHDLMGLWLGRDGDVYVATYGDRTVKRVSRRGRVEVVARSPLPWRPTGGLLAPDGDLYVLECSTTNAVRVRRVAAGAAVSLD